MRAIAIIEQLEELSPPELLAEIEQQRDRIALMERVYAIITGDAIKTGKRQPRKPKQPPTGEPATSAADGDSQAVDTTQLRRRIVDILKAQGPQSWSQLLSLARAHVSVLGPALRESQVEGQVEKAYGVYRAVGK